MLFNFAYTVWKNKGEKFAGPRRPLRFIFLQNYYKKYGNHLIGGQDQPITTGQNLVIYATWTDAFWYFIFLAGKAKVIEAQVHLRSPLSLPPHPHHDMQSHSPMFT